MHISDLDHLKNIKDISFKEEKVVDDKFTIVSYMISYPELWKKEKAIECRGITFDDKGNCVCRPFEKFFNLNENEWVQEHNLDFKNSIAFEKVDGSMVTPVYIESYGSSVLKTKKSFHSDVAFQANQFANEDFFDICDVLLLEYGITPIFEFIGPTNKIVIDYDETKFVLLTGRYIRSGKYIDLNELVNLLGSRVSYSKVARANIITPKVFDLGTDELKKAVEKENDKEGWVILLNNGLRVKVKTDWYLAQHNLMSVEWDFNAKTVKGVARLIASNEIDDYRSHLNEDQKRAVEWIEKRVLDDFNDFKFKLDDLVNLFYTKYNESIKEFVMNNSHDQFHKIAISYIKEKTILFSDIFEKFYSNNYTNRMNSFGQLVYDLKKEYNENERRRGIS